MKPTIEMITAELRKLSTAEKREVFPRFFKAGKGEYGEGDRFLGVTVPNVRSVARLHKDIALADIWELMLSEWHEARLCALLIMVEKSKKKDEVLRRQLLYRLARSPLLWDNRIAIVSTYAFIRKGQLEDTYALGDLMMHHTHDLMHKAIGWMLREAGKRDPERLYDYVLSHRAEMPRTMLRYAIEKFSPQERSILMRRT